MFKGCSFSPHIDENGEYEGPIQKHLKNHDIIGPMCYRDVLKVWIQMM